ncbi:condensation domain-containing protein [Streptomyces dubilierae]|uniref:Condensation domain-containing protein n=1 Tax=Streptomyces dubilierae TaxID=3075533 RepID=A0ABU2P1S6_9ACTN|nr:condensation domain-containing protein [Streptomyces sp. DSM 41921]MDT0386093.1 condensation domain-containing protein [Streptomyces sp. DSM 41921]
MQPIDAGPLSLGQLSVWHDIRELPPSRRHEPNNAAVWDLPPGTAPDAVRAALACLARRHPSLRTRYDLRDPDAPRQWVAEETAPVVLPTAPAGGAPAEDQARVLAGEPFDLGREDGWRARLVGDASGSQCLVFVKHHILADAWAQEVLRRELLREIAVPGSLRATAPGPLHLAAEQHGPTGLRRQRAALERWERLGSRAPAARLPDSGDAPGEVVQATLRSAPALAAARAFAGRAGVSVASAVMAAYVRAVARRCGSDALLVHLMSANRFAGRWKDVVTSMNQWVPALVEGARADLTSLAGTVHWSSLRAVRHGMSDVTAVAALRTRAPQALEPACAFNHVAAPPGDEARAAADAEGPAEPALSFETPFTTIGPRCYARSQEDGQVLTVRLTARDVGRAECVALLWELHDALLTAA